ncbi:type II toxin-antitoxin system PemI/MazE family antitoxin [Lentilactobacillus sunkii]|uniref:SpoVT-AbrB domain-containing protein n=1 Tax=Lentilactobacillus sunkii DSM 19904 TaxID=1423808 RepID=A0A0R1L971_9LACO|nr:hypothetical protein [Lentilactobacillus sunkii]KRK89505.1 hypothetical protein FD17_GL001090 [Lentilactobacillus sunkii DSM 19904]
MNVKTRKQGNSLVITIPSEFKIDENVEYTPVKDENGVISFVPVHHNIFDENPNYDFKKALKEMDIQDNGKAVGKEDVW